MDILIIDDDACFAEMLARMAVSSGYVVEKRLDANGAVEAVRELKPRLVILDIMMPGLDGLTLCKALKADPSTSGVKILVCSSKSFKQDSENARRCGADAFLSKRAGIAETRKAIRGLIGGPLMDLATPTAGSLKPPKPAVMRVRVWGASPGPLQGGPPTVCVSVELPSETGQRLLILDAGTGLSQLAPSPPGPPEEVVWLLLSRCCEEHTAGLPGLAKALRAAHTLKVGAPMDPQAPVKALLRERIGESSFAGLKVYGLSESSFEPWPGVKVWAMWTNHPGPTLAYRVTCKDKSFVYCPCNAIDQDGRNRVQSEYNAKLCRLVRGTDLLLHDARHIDADILVRGGDGHSCPNLAVGMAAEAGARRLLLFGPDPSYTGAMLENGLKVLQSKMAQAACVIPVSYALPGETVDL